MNKKLVGAWVHALKSGRYIHGKGYLNTVKDDGTCTHCAFGVLCDIVDPEKWGPVDVNVSEDGERHRRYNDKHNMYPPSELMETLLEDNYEHYSGFMHHILRLNDSTDSYAEVLRYIERLQTKPLNVKELERED